MKKTLIIGVSVLLVASIAFAVTTKKIKIGSLRSFLSGKTEWVEISALGKIRPSQAYKKYQLDEQQVWSILAHSSGRYFVGTGLHGRVLMLDRKKKIRTVLDTEGVIISSLVEGRGGGKPDSAQAGGQAPEKIADALAEARVWVTQQVGN